MVKMSFAKACRETFGLKVMPDGKMQNLQQFAQEIKGVYMSDPMFWMHEFALVGIELEPAPTSMG